MNRLLLLSVDGLSPDQFSNILEHMPRVRELLRPQHLAPLNSSPFTAAQPIWAQILTGRNWYETGCTGYSRPKESLNRLQVFRESLLLTPVNLISNSENSICVNVPILEAKDRIWLTDGSQPSLRVVNPADIAQHFSGSPYRPRAYSNLALALRSRYESAARALQLEKQRLSATRQILEERDWNEAIVRLSIFDLLQHLFGSDCLADSQLLIQEQIHQFIEYLEEFWLAIASMSREMILVSAYSHVKCRARLNLNGLLKQSAYLTLASESSTAARTATKRTEAFAAVSGQAVSGATLASTEGALSCEHTLAAAPVSGCIYLNRELDFEDGILSDAEEESVASELRDILGERLEYYFAGRANICEKPSGTARDIRCLPRFIIHIPSVDFFDALESILDRRDKPAVCHSSQGFAWGRELSDREISPIEFSAHLRSRGFGAP